MQPGNADRARYCRDRRAVPVTLTTSAILDGGIPRPSGMTLQGNAAGHAHLSERLPDTRRPRRW